MMSKSMCVFWSVCILCILSGCGAAPSATATPTAITVTVATAATPSTPVTLATPSVFTPTPSTSSAPPFVLPPSLLVSPTPQPPQLLKIFTHIPVSDKPPLQIVVMLHGIGGEGKAFAASLLKEADRNHWLLVSPTLDYQDWHNPSVVAREDVENALRLAATLDSLTAQTGITTRPKVHLYGFSRGAQFAQRFALFFPERVARVVAFSAGAYTLPDRKTDVVGDGRPAPVPLPYGISDAEKQLNRTIDRAQLKQVRFLIVVGEKDNIASDVPRAWDPYQGTTRLERARVFCQSLGAAGITYTLKIIPNVGHEINPTMQNLAINFLHEADAPLGKQAIANAPQ